MCRDISILRQSFPNAKFLPASSEDTISAAETTLGVVIPPELRSLYLECDGFREGRGNAKYLLSLLEEDLIGSLVSITKFFWTEFTVPDLTPFVFFGSSSGDECWGINYERPDEIIAYHHHMGSEYEVVGADILRVWQEDYARYDEVT